MKTIKRRIGWKEWCALPMLDLPRVTAKIDTGALTSSLHAFDIRTVEKKGQTYVQFSVHPLHGSEKISVRCEALLVDRRYVRSSNGHRELRHVIRTNLAMGEEAWGIEITLADRAKMEYRMLLGRRALASRFLIDPGRKFCLGKFSRKEAREVYKKE